MLDYIFRNRYNESKYNSKKGVSKMDKKKLILTSLASVAVLGAAFAASQPSVVKAEETMNKNNFRNF